MEPAQMPKSLIDILCSIGASADEQILTAVLESVEDCCRTSLIFQFTDCVLTISADPDLDTINGSL